MKQKMEMKTAIILLLHTDYKTADFSKNICLYLLIKNKLHIVQCQHLIVYFPAITKTLVLYFSFAHCSTM